MSPLPWIDAGPDPAPGTAPTWIQHVEPVPLTGLWRLDEASGNALDRSGTSPPNAGTYNGTITRSVDGPTPGSKCVLFDGNSGYVSVPASASLNAIAAAWTLAAWIYPTLARTTGNVASSPIAGVSATPGYTMGYGSTAAFVADTRIWAGFYSGSWRIATDPNPVTLNAWLHYGATWDGTTVRLYRNGAEVATHAPGGGVVPGATASGIVIARRYDTGGASPFFPGRVWNARVYPTALAAAQMLALYQRQAAIARPWFPLGAVT